METGTNIVLGEQTAMKQKKTAWEIRTLWIDEKKRIISFQKLPGMQEMRFPSRDAMLAFAMEKGESGYRIM